MTGPEQIEAKRRNAAQNTGSRTGSRTEAGKAASSRNALAESALLNAAPERKLHQCASGAEEKSQQNPQKIGFVSQKCINRDARELRRKILRAQASGENQPFPQTERGS